MRIPKFVPSSRTARLLAFEIVRARARWLHRRRVAPPVDRLHLGCGRKRVPGWFNVDVIGSEYDVDLAAGRLPFTTGAFTVAVAQHVIEHLDLFEALLPLLRELRRVIRPGGELWLSCPDLETVCRSYDADRAAALLADRVSRMPTQGLRYGVPSQQFINVLFHQAGQHKNLFDFDLVNWAVNEAGFAYCERVNEAALLSRFPEFPRRDDDLQSLAVVVR